MNNKETLLTVDDIKKAFEEGRRDSIRNEQATYGLRGRPSKSGLWPRNSRSHYESLHDGFIHKDIVKDIVKKNIPDENIN